MSPLAIAAIRELLSPLLIPRGLGWAELPGQRLTMLHYVNALDRCHPRVAADWGQEPSGAEPRTLETGRFAAGTDCRAGVKSQDMVLQVVASRLVWSACEQQRLAHLSVGTASIAVMASAKK